MSTWTEQLTARARPAAVLDVLTDPRACGRWAPVDFEVQQLDGDRLRAGSRARVAGRLAGRQVGFDVEVLAADEERLALLARGPVALDVEYRLRPVAAGSEVHASVAVQPGRPGLGARVLAQATAALLSGGALKTTVAAIAREAALL
ncbi:MAG: SRPBCC family protein [Solirubrobacterales bacterium]|nr:SRPBCC family protein [Solirubrobacterales bacterium]